MNRRRSLFALKKYEEAKEAYKKAIKIEPKKGYWIAISSAATNTIVGKPLYNYTVHFDRTGWYMIGSVISDTDFIEPDDNPNGQVISPAYFWNVNSMSYSQADTLKEKKGYWVAVLGECDLTIGSGSNQSFEGKALAKVNLSKFKYPFNLN